MKQTLTVSQNTASRSLCCPHLCLLLLGDLNLSRWLMQDTEMTMSINKDQQNDDSAQWPEAKLFELYSVKNRHTKKRVQNGPTAQRANIRSLASPGEDRRPQRRWAGSRGAPDTIQAKAGPHPRRPHARVLPGHGPHRRPACVWPGQGWRPGTCPAATHQACPGARHAPLTENNVSPGPAALGPSHGGGDGSPFSVRGQLPVLPPQARVPCLPCHRSPGCRGEGTDSQDGSGRLGLRPSVPGPWAEGLERGQLPQG